MASPDYFAADVPILAAHLERRWPGVRINRARLHLDERRDNSEFAGELCIQVNLSGELADVLSSGVISQADVDRLPPCGVGISRGRRIHRSKKGRLRVELFIKDPPNPFFGDRRFDVELFDLLAATLAPDLWQPPMATI